MTAKVLAEKLAAKAKNSKVFARYFSYDTSYFEPITVEIFVDSKFTKYINNDGNPCQKVLSKSSIIEQAETLVYFFHGANNEKFLLVDLQEADYYKI